MLIEGKFWVGARSRARESNRVREILRCAWRTAPLRMTPSRRNS